jgi:hypothetical protein
MKGTSPWPIKGTWPWPVKGTPLMKGIWR